MVGFALWIWAFLPLGRARAPVVFPGLVMHSADLGLPADFRGPPARAYQQESPVGEKFGRLAFEGVADELEGPSQDEQSEGYDPRPVDEEREGETYEREQDKRDADGVAGAVYGVLMAGGVLRDPVVP